MGSSSGPWHEVCYRTNCTFRLPKSTSSPFHLRILVLPISWQFLVDYIELTCSYVLHAWGSFTYLKFNDFFNAVTQNMHINVYEILYVFMWKQSHILRNLSSPQEMRYTKLPILSCLKKVSKTGNYGLFQDQCMTRICRCH